MPTLIEQHLIKGSSVEVPCQTDTDYAKVAANQCSWVAAQFAKRRDELFATYVSDKRRFVEIYRECLCEGSRLRREHGKISCGENIDNESVLEKTNIGSEVQEKWTYTENEIMLQMVKDFIPQDMLHEFCGRVHSRMPNLELKDAVNFVLLSRHAQSFAALPFEDKYLVLDSHTTYCGLMTKENLCNYIKMDGATPGGYLHAIMLFS